MVSKQLSVASFASTTCRCCTISTVVWGVELWTWEFAVSSQKRELGLSWRELLPSTVTLGEGLSPKVAKDPILLYRIVLD